MARSGLGAAAAAGETGPAAAPCTIITAALLSPRCMQVAVSMEKPPGTCLAGGGANELELRRLLWLEVGSVRQRRRAQTGPAAAPCTTITAALLSPRCMQVSMSMEKLTGTCFVGGGTNGVGLRRSLWLEVGSAWCQWPRGAWVLVPSPHHVLLLWCLLPGLQEGQGLQIGLLVALGERHGAEVRVSR